jgi:hypothetical protein
MGAVDYLPTIDEITASKKLSAIEAVDNSKGYLVVSKNRKTGKIYPCDSCDVTGQEMVKKNIPAFSMNLTRCFIPPVTRPVMLCNRCYFELLGKIIESLQLTMNATANRLARACPRDLEHRPGSLVPEDSMGM